MHARIVTFTGARDVDAGIRFARDEVLPMLREQQGYRGLVANVDRDAGILGVLSLWATAEDRDVTESTLGPTRKEAAELVQGDVQVERFEQFVAEIGDQPPAPGSALMLTRVSMDPERIDDNIAFFRSEIVPQIRATPGFRAVRNLMNRETGDGVVGVALADQAAAKQAAEESMARREEAIARGVHFGDISFREIVLVDLP